MTPTSFRDRVGELAKTNVARAEAITKKINDPWFEAQAWSHLARWAETPLPFAKRAENAAVRTKDDYQRSAVRAWEIAALGERGYAKQARKALSEAVNLAMSIENFGSRAEALFLLFQAGFKVSNEDATAVGQAFLTSSSGHWREKRARKLIGKMLEGEMPPREFYW